MADKRLDRLRVVRRIARGGMAEVFLAVGADEAGHERRVAVKKILPLYAGQEEVARRFRDEQRLGSLLEHSGIVRIQDVGKDDGEAYIAMEFVDGPDLDQVLERCGRRSIPMPVDLVAHIGARLAAALTYAHELTGADGAPLHLVHRDVSPPNVLLGVDGSVKLTDFGVAWYRERESATTPGVVQGRFHCMSPEQISGHPVDGRSDLFSLGALMYRALTGRHPFEADDDRELRARIRKARPAAPSALRRDCPPALERVLLRCLVADPEGRYPSARELLADLSHVAPRRPAGAQMLRAFLLALFPDADSPQHQPLPQGAAAPWEDLCHRLSPADVPLPDPPHRAAPAQAPHPAPRALPWAVGAVAIPALVWWVARLLDSA